MNCTKIYQHICDNLDRNLRSRKCREIKKHLDGCPNCTAYLDSLKKTVSFYRREPVPRMPRRAHRRLVKIIEIAMLGVEGRSPAAQSRKSRPH